MIEVGDFVVCYPPHALNLYYFGKVSHITQGDYVYCIPWIRSDLKGTMQSSGYKMDLCKKADIQIEIDE